MFLKSKSIQKKLLISIIIVALTYSNFTIVGSNIYKGLISYALDGVEVRDDDYSREEETTPKVTVETTGEGRLDTEPGTIGEITPITEPAETQETPVASTEETNPLEVQEEADEIICEVNLESNDLHKTKMEEETEFTEKLNIHMSKVNNVIITDVNSVFYDNNEEETENAKLKYVKTTLNKVDLLNLLGENGVLTIKENENILAEISKEFIEGLEIDEKTPITYIIKVEKENDEGEIVEEEQDELRTYITVSEETVELEYVLEVKNPTFIIDNIKIEDEANNIRDINFVIENTKSIFDVLDLDNLNYLKENVDYTFNNEEETTTPIEEDNETEENEEEQESDIVNIIKFKDTITRAKLEINTNKLIRGQENTIEYKITLDTTSEKEEMFVNPLFVLELPECIESINSEKSQYKVVNDGGAFTDKDVSIISLLGKKYVVVNLYGEQTAETIENGDAYISILLNVNVEDGEETNETTKLFYRNSTVTAYESGLGFDTDEADFAIVLGEAQNIDNSNQEVENNNDTLEDNEDQGQEDNDISQEKSYMEINSTIDKSIVRAGEEFEYIVSFYGLEETEEVNKFEFKYLIPEYLELIDLNMFGLELNDGVYRFTKALETKNITQVNDNVLRIDMMQYKYEKIQLIIKVKAKKLEKDIYSANINSEVQLVKNDSIIEKKTDEKTVSDEFLKLKYNKILTEYEKDSFIEFKVEIKNLGLLPSKSVMTVSYELPIDLTLVSIRQDRQKSGTSGGVIPDTEKNEFTISEIDGEDTVTITILTQYRSALKADKDINVKAIINGENEINWTTKLLKIETFVNLENDPEEDTEGQEDEGAGTETSSGNNDEGITPNDGDNETVDNGIDSQNPKDGTDTEKDKENENEKYEFDLSLKQFLKKITVTNKEGTTIYNYENAKLAKVEIPSKYMNDSTVTLEYEVTIKNEGNIAGYARKIVDYLPKELTFISELNPDWYVGDDGNIYSVALLEELLRPGETEKLNIVLTKQMTNTNSGTVVNVIEICEASNDENIEDINSIPGDKLEGQNDIDKVEVVIAVKTGTIVLYTLLAIVVLTILGYGTFSVKKLTLNKKEDK